MSASIVRISVMVNEETVKFEALKSIINFSFHLLQIIFIYFFYFITRPIKYLISKKKVPKANQPTKPQQKGKEDAEPKEYPLVEKRTLGELGVYSDPNLTKNTEPIREVDIIIFFPLQTRLSYFLCMRLKYFALT